MAEGEGTTTPYSTGEYKNQDKAREHFIASELRGRLQQYPSEIANESPHYVGFYPLIRTASKTGKRLEEQFGEEAIFDIEGQNRSDSDNTALAAGAAGALAGAGAGGVLSVANTLGLSGGGGGTAGRALGGIRRVASAGINAVAGGVVGGLAGGAAAATANESKLIAGGGGIFLQITSMQAQYKANWESADMGAFAGAIGAGNASFSAGDLGELAARSASNVSKVLGGPGVSDIIDAGTKTVKNPYKEQLFRSMDNRRFSFDYVFAPKNAEEAETVFATSRTSDSGAAVLNSGGIIQQFAFHMHPELQSSGYYFTYPSEFLIVYYHNGNENEFVRKISNAVLTDMKVEYGADGFTTFSNGMPSMATMTLTFTELEILTSQRIYKGY